MDLYRHLPPDGVPELVHGIVAPAASILDLGCGAGRIAGPLARLGHAVTGVDDAPEMLEAMPEGVEGVLGDGRTIRLGRRFGAVLLASHLVNDLTDGVRFAGTAAEHLAPGGVVVAEAYPVGWDTAAAVGHPGRFGPVTITLVRAAVSGDVLDAAVRYELEGATWEQPFTARLLDRAALTAVLAAGGLRFDRWLARPGWFVAVA